MAQYIIIYEITGVKHFTFDIHYRLYDEHKNLIIEENKGYTLHKSKRPLTHSLKSHIAASIWMHLKNKKIVSMTDDRYTSSCLATAEQVKGYLDKIFCEGKEKLFKPKSTYDSNDNPRIYRVVLVNGNYTIIKAETKYLSREEAKEELFKRQLEDA